MALQTLRSSLEVQIKSHIKQAAWRHISNHILDRSRQADHGGEEGRRAALTCLVEQQHGSQHSARPRQHSRRSHLPALHATSAALRRSPAAPRRTPTLLQPGIDTVKLGATVP